MALGGERAGLVLDGDGDNCADGEEACWFVTDFVFILGMLISVIGVFLVR